MIAVHGWLTKENLRSKLIMQVHDELVLEVPDDEIETIKNELPLLMGEVAKLDVPLLVEGRSGAELGKSALNWAFDKWATHYCLCLDPGSSSLS